MPAHPTRVMTGPTKLKIVAWSGDAGALAARLRVSEREIENLLARRGAAIKRYGVMLEVRLANPRAIDNAIMRLLRCGDGGSE